MKILMIALICLALSGCTATTNFLWGTTVDDVTNTQKIVDGAKNLPIRGATRIVFDPGETPADYAPTITALHPYSTIMGELVDSSSVKATTTTAYHNKTASFLKAFGNQIDIYEIGNEVNGEWLGTTASVITKISDAYNQVHAAGQKSALTLYYNPDCWSTSSHEMFTWAKNIPATMAAGLDYVLISYYEGDCNNHRMSVAETQTVFDRLHTMFPHALLGFGEVGLGNDATVTSTNLTKAQNLMTWYYSLRPTTPGYIVGGFWWHWYQDGLPWTTKPLWKTFAALEQ